MEDGAAEGEPVGEVVDLFCGVGALSHGLKQAGFAIRAGYDTDRRCKFAFETNNDSTFHARDVSKLTAKEVRAHFSGDKPSVLAGCAPCQPFSTYKQRYDEDPQWGLVENFGRLAIEVRPDFVTMENVPALERYKSGAVFKRFVSILREGGYSVDWTIAKCEEFGVPQRRRRLVLIAAKDRQAVKLNAGRTAAVSVLDAIGELPKLAAGESHADDSLHVASSLSELNLRRIRASKPGGTWRDWPMELRAACHRKPSGKTYPGVYARMTWDDPSPTMTTQCYGFGNGRFGHPDQDRAISLREAAILQSFPPDYQFLPKAEKPSLKEVGRWIGNAVPVKLGEAIGHEIVQLHYGDAGRG
ncbi:site-specific DNA-methyltransferase [Erythrobacter sp. NAP1]|uniref:DNA cytosine methyltransferase n=1 Tax=Erythrobacter sp. NAP1 TaxID=237727 RepID=UPI0000687651|nr:DNA cytosine methyltransferase [Erythrobacter sp. NAP1]EAQ28633.1 site-specific DNA-methyltransferase [Erythrobacter sp. NAP1]